MSLHRLLVDWTVDLSPRSRRALGALKTLLAVYLFSRLLHGGIGVDVIGEIMGETIAVLVIPFLVGPIEVLWGRGFFQLYDDEQLGPTALFVLFVVSMFSLMYVASLLSMSPLGRALGLGMVLRSL